MPNRSGHILAKAVTRAAAQLQLSRQHIAAIIGVSEETVALVQHEIVDLEPNTGPFRHAILLIRLYLSLKVLTAGDLRTAALWMASQNAALSTSPIDKIQTKNGLIEVVSYLDGRQSLA